MKRLRFSGLIATLLAAALVLGCSSTTASVSPTSTPLLNASALTPAPVVIPTATPGEAAQTPSTSASPVPTTAPASTAAASPVPTAPAVAGSGRTLTLTRDDNGKQVSANRGDRIVVSLGQDLDWTVKASDTSLLTATSPPADAQAAYFASATGSSTITGSGAPHCAPGAICPLIRVAFQATVNVS